MGTLETVLGIRLATASPYRFVYEVLSDASGLGLSEAGRARVLRVVEGELERLGMVRVKGGGGDGDGGEGGEGGKEGKWRWRDRDGEVVGFEERVWGLGGALGLEVQKRS